MRAGRWAALAAGPRGKHANLQLALLCALAAAANALLMGPDLFWDNLNYHIYNAYAALNGRLALDVAPAGVHSYFNPTADFFYYALMRGLARLPVLAALIQSVWYAITLFFVLKLTRLCLPRAKSWMEPAAALLIFVSSPAVLAWGTANTGDMISAAPLIASLYLTLTSCTRPASQTKTLCFLAAGALYGLSFALKYTAAPFLIAYFVMFCFCFGSFKEWLKYGLWFTGGALAAFLLADGWWLWKMYKEFQNPFFPFYNNIFHSPLFDSVALTDKRFFVGKEWWELLLLPLTFLYNRQMNAIESFSRAGTYLAYWVSIIYLAARLRRTARTPGLNAQAVKPLLIFLAAGYVLWLLQFALLRYAMPMEAAGAAAVTAAVFTFCKGRGRAFTAGILCGIIAFYTVTPRTPQPFSGKTMEIFSAPGTLSKMPPSVRYGAPKITDGSTVILPAWKLSYLIPYLNPRARYVGGIQPDIYNYDSVIARLQITNTLSFSPVFYRHRFAPAAREAVRAAPRVYALVPSYAPKMYFTQPLKHYGVQINPENCQWIFTSWDYPVLLCEAEKI